MSQRKSTSRKKPVSRKKPASRKGSKSRRRGGPPRAAYAAALLMVIALLASAWWGWRQARESVDPAEDPFARQVELPPEPDPIARVEVLNGAGEPGAAQEAAEILRGAGFDVVYFGNASDFDNPRTRVIARVGSGGRADSVAGWLQVDRLERDVDPTMHLDATIVLGADWRRRLRLAVEATTEAELDP